MYGPLRALASLITHAISSLFPAFCRHLLKFVPERFSTSSNHLKLGLSVLPLPCCLLSCAVFLGDFSKLRKATTSFVMSIRLYVCQHGTTRSHWTNFEEILYLSFFENASRKFEVYYNPTAIIGTLHEDVLIFMTISH